MASAPASRPPSDYRNCDPNVRARVGTTTCVFALNAFYEYYVQMRPNRMDVWSPAARAMLATRCRSGNWIVCRTGDGGVAEFPVSAVDGYDTALAKAYAAHHPLGPDTQKGTASNRAERPARQQAEQTERVCYPAVDLPAVTLPATTLPAVTLPPVDVGGTHYPAQHYPAQHYPAQHYGAQHYGGQCFNAPAVFAPANTSLLPTDAYRVIDTTYSTELTNQYWDSAGNAINNPDPTASGFGEFNAAGFPKNEYVRPYVRQDGTMVSGYWRNSPTDGLPTCQLISC